MCLGIPGEVVDVRDDAGLRVGRVRFAGITREVCLDYVPDIAVGEYVLVHVGFAISKIDREEAERSYRILEDIGQTAELTADQSPDALPGGRTLAPDVGWALPTASAGTPTRRSIPITVGDAHPRRKTGTGDP